MRAKTSKAHRRRSGRCVCGVLVAQHFDAQNRKLSCSEVGRLVGFEMQTFAATLARLAARKEA